MQRKSENMAPWGALAVALGALAAGAPEAAAQSKRDAAFAEVLLRAGYLDLAEEEARRIEQATTYPGDVRGDAGYLLVRILKVQANAAMGSRAQELLDEVQRLIDELKTRYPTHQASQVADLEKLQAQLSEADTVLGNARDETDEAEAAKLNDRAIELYQSALETFDQVIAEIEKALEKNATDDLEFRRDLSEYLRANAYLNYGTALGSLEQKSADRQAALEKSEKLFASFFDERGSYFNLWTLSYLGRGKALVELGRYDEAAELLAEMAYIAPPGHPDPQIARQQAEFVRELLGEGTYWQINAAVRAKRYDTALQAFSAYEKAFPKYLETHFGKLAVFEYAKALAALDRVRAAGDAIQTVLEWSMQGDVIPGFDIDRYGVAACKVLAEISAGTSGFLPAPLQYRAGQGFFFKREWERATYALKGVLASGSSDEERARWGPRALIDLGAAYQHLGRPLEAALAFQGLYRMFPDNDRARDAMRFAKLNLEGLAKTDPWYRELIEEVVRDEQELLTGVGRERSVYEQAVGFQRLEQYARAAQKYLEVKPEVPDRTGANRKVPFYGEALANAGYCFYLAASSGQGNPAQMRQRAQETLAQAMAYGRENDQPDAWAAAAYYLSVIASSDEEKRYKEALEVLEAFDGPLKGQTNYLARAYAQQVTCHVKLGDLRQAEERVDRLGERFAEGSDLPMAALEVGIAYIEAADELIKEQKLSEANGLEKRAGRLVGIWVERSKRASFSGAAWAGDVLLRAAMLERAVQAFERALGIAKSRDDLPPADRDELVYESTLMQYARALNQTGRTPDALKVLEQVKAGYETAGQDPLKDFGYAYALSHALYDHWQKTKQDSIVVPLRQAHEAYWSIVRTADDDSWPSFIRNYRLPTQPFFRAKLDADARLLEIRLAMKEWRLVRFEVDQLEKQGWLDDQVDLVDGSWLAGEILSEGADGAIKIQVRNAEERTLQRSEVQSVDRFPQDLRKRFFDIRERAIREGKL